MANKGGNKEYIPKTGQDEWFQDPSGLYKGAYKQIPLL